VIIGNWLRNRNTIEFLGIWEQLNNPNFKVIEFDDFKKSAGLNSLPSPQNNGSKKQRPLGLSQKRDVMAALMLKKTLRLSLPVGFQLNLNFT